MSVYRPDYKPVIKNPIDLNDSEDVCMFLYVCSKEEIQIPVEAWEFFSEDDKFKVLSYAINCLTAMTLAGNMPEPPKWLKDLSVELPES